MIFILCSGKQTRWKGPGFKQLTEINGTPLLLDTISKLNVNHVRVVTPHIRLIKYCKRRLIKTIIPKDYHTLPATVFSLHKFFEDENIILLGDVFYTQDSINKILSEPANIFFNGDDVFAVKLSKKEYMESHLLFNSFRQYQKLNPHFISYEIKDSTRDFDTYQDYLSWRHENELISKA